jgi:hypothetical protein
MNLLFVIDRYPDSSPQLPRFGSTRYTHIFYQVLNVNLVYYWQDMYSRLTLTKQKLAFYEFSSKNYKKYPLFEPWVFKIDYYRTQCNQDKFIIKGSRSVVLHALREEHYDQLPTFFLRGNDKRRELGKMHLMYSTLSGWGQSTCKFSNIYHQLSLLTQDFNAFDMLFCDVFNYYNITPLRDFNFGEFRYMRPFFFRDDLTTSFPPDPNSVFYESPGITFIMLREEPIVWRGIVRPFTIEVWIAVAVSLIVALLFTRIVFFERRSRRWVYLSGADIAGRSLVSNFARMKVQELNSERVWKMSVNTYRLVLTSAYSGMILGGILEKSYPWSPNTFKELNETNDVVIATALSSAVGLPKLIGNDSSLLNGILLRSNENMKSVGGRKLTINREDPSEGKPSLGMYLLDDENDTDYRYALFMYDDKKYLWIHSKHELWMTNKFIHRIENEKEVVDREMRYMSVAPGATHLHVVIQGIRNCFETGSWKRWKYLEDNYFKYVAPVVAWSYYGVEEDWGEIGRALNVEDFWSTGWVLSGGLSCGGILFLIEAYGRIWREFLRGIGGILSGLSKFCFLTGFGLVRVKAWLNQLNMIDTLN